MSLEILSMSTTQNYTIGILCFKTKCYIKTKLQGTVCMVANNTLQQYVENYWWY